MVALDLDHSGAEATGRLVAAAGARALALKCDAGREEDIIAAVRRTVCVSLRTYFLLYLS